MDNDNVRLKFSFEVGIDTSDISDSLLDMIVESLKHDVNSVLVKQSCLVSGFVYSKNIECVILDNGVDNA